MLHREDRAHQTPSVTTPSWFGEVLTPSAVELLATRIRLSRELILTKSLWSATTGPLVTSLETQFTLRLAAAQLVLPRTLQLVFAPKYTWTPLICLVVLSVFIIPWFIAVLSINMQIFLGA